MSGPRKRLPRGRRAHALLSDTVGFVWDIPLIAKVADTAHTWIYQEGRGGTGNGNGSAAGD